MLINNSVLKVKHKFPRELCFLLLTTEGVMSCFGRNYKALVPTAAVTSPGLFKEGVSTETPGRLPLGPVVLLGQLSGRPLGLVCVCMHLCFPGRPIKGSHQRAGFNIFTALSLSEGFNVRM